ncbi:hypothetical protein C8R44DRAFT_892556 [Mycena epipterygia]|nr:hypothetical protein C8R44DRAFT_892556 [Mycena epipterygia]
MPKTRTKIKERKTRPPKTRHTQLRTRERAPAHDSKGVEGARSLAQKKLQKTAQQHPKEECESKKGTKNTHTRRKKNQAKQLTRTLPSALAHTLPRAQQTPHPASLAQPFVPPPLVVEVEVECECTEAEWPALEMELEERSALSEWREWTGRDEKRTRVRG